MALRGRRIKNFLELWWLVALGVVGIWVSSTSFQKIDIGWPQQPLTEIVLISVKNWIFDDPLHKNGPTLVILGQEQSNHQDQEVFWWNRALEVVEAIEAAEADEVVEAAEVLMPEKSLMRTSEASRFWILALFWCFEKSAIWGIITKYHFEF